MTNPKSPAPESLTMLRQWQVLGIVPVSQATLKRWVRAGRFPAPIKLSEKVSAWRAGDVQAWVDAQAVS
ncbi:transcriptional regulator, AlpA family [Burkholderia sp. D7]|nr:transcriptional regulator, AlpA family [Burkholderia sp. D7]